MKYYCEPWEVDFDSSHDGIYAIDDNGGTDIATVWGMKDDGSEVSKRIVDCVNACAGMEKPAEEIANLKSEAEKWERIATLAWEEKHRAVDKVGRLREALVNIYDYGVDRDGEKTAKRLGELVDELVSIAKHTLDTSE